MPKTTRAGISLVREQFSGGLALAAHATEDATDYARERETQEQLSRRRGSKPRPLCASGMNEHTAALQRAIDAQARARGETPPSQQQATQPLPNYVEPDAPDYAMHMVAAQERFSNYFDNPIEHRRPEHGGRAQGCGDEMAGRLTIRAVNSPVTTWLQSLVRKWPKPSPLNRK